MVVGMLEQTLHQSLAKLEAAAKVTREASAASRQTRSTSRNHVNKSELTVVHAQERLDQKKAGLRRSAHAVDAAKKVLGERQEEFQSRGLKGLEVKTELKSFEGTLNHEWKALVDGKWRGTEVETYIKNLEPLWTRLALEDSMEAALPRALRKKPAERGPFDKMLLEQCNNQLQEKVKDLRKQVRQVLSGELAHAVTAAERKLDVELKAQIAANEAIATAGRAPICMRRAQGSPSSV